MIGKEKAHGNILADLRALVASDPFPQRVHPEDVSTVRRRSRVHRDHRGASVRGERMGGHVVLADDAGIMAFENAQFGTIRVSNEGGEPWFVASDVAGLSAIAWHPT